MKIKTIFLTLITTTGITFQNCNSTVDEDILECDCPHVIGNYFDISGMKLVHFRQFDDSGASSIHENMLVNFSDYHSLQIEYAVKYYSKLHKKKN
ncbi:MAG: hypothetical protein AAGI07_16720 [Bacteroidota bacterium]